MAAAMTSMALSPAGLRAAPLRPAFGSGRVARCVPKAARCMREERSAAGPAAEQSTLARVETSMLATAALLAPLLLDIESASAAGNPLLTGKTISLVHPLVMFGLLGSSIYTGVLGWNWRRTRLIPAEIKELKAQLPAAREDGTVPASPAGDKIMELEALRKEINKDGSVKDKHFNWGSVLLGGGVTFAIAGPLNTFLRTGKLFPGPHLYAGAAIVVLWALAAAMVPYMQKGNDTARNAHIAFNAVNVALFLWQVPTGLDIVYKVWEFAAWP